MKNIVAAVFLAILAAATFALAYAYTRPARFQLVSARVLGRLDEKDEARVFLLDTLTGRVWSYYTPNDEPDEFINVRVDGLHGGAAMESLRAELEKLKELQALRNSKEYQEYQELKKAKANSH
ncbi:MAG: hypothetical protein ACLQVM_24605 [Terriglobia bacterium]